MPYKTVVDPQIAGQLVQVYTTYVIVAGLLTTSTYPAVYAPYSLDNSDTELVGESFGEQFFRFLNGVSFVCSLITIVGSLSFIQILVSPNSLSDIPLGPVKTLGYLHYTIFLFLHLTICLAVVGVTAWFAAFPTDPSFVIANAVILLFILIGFLHWLRLFPWSRKALHMWGEDIFVLGEAGEVEEVLGRVFLKQFGTFVATIIQDSSEVPPTMLRLLDILQDKEVTEHADEFREKCVNLYIRYFPSRTVPPLFRQTNALVKYFNSEGSHWGATCTEEFWLEKTFVFDLGKAYLAALHAVGMQEGDDAGTFELPQLPTLPSHSVRVELQPADDNTGLHPARSNKDL